MTSGRDYQSRSFCFHMGQTFKFLILKVEECYLQQSEREGVRFYDTALEKTLTHATALERLQVVDKLSNMRYAMVSCSGPATTETFDECRFCS